jgi:hypothetical protein
MEVVLKPHLGLKVVLIPAVVKAQILTQVDLKLHLALNQALTVMEVALKLPLAHK